MRLGIRMSRRHKKAAAQRFKVRIGIKFVAINERRTLRVLARREPHFKISAMINTKYADLQQRWVRIERNDEPSPEG